MTAPIRRPLGAATEPLPLLVYAVRRPVWQVDAQHYVAVDDGCEWAALDARFGRCTTCPLSVCKFDLPNTVQHRLRAVLRTRAGQRSHRPR